MTLNNIRESQPGQNMRSSVECDDPHRGRSHTRKISAVGTRSGLAAEPPHTRATCKILIDSERRKNTRASNDVGARQLVRF